MNKFQWLEATARQISKQKIKKKKNLESPKMHWEVFCPCKLLPVASHSMSKNRFIKLVLWLRQKNPTGVGIKQKKLSFGCIL